MGRYANYNTTVDDSLYLSIKSLKEWNYFNFGTRSGTIDWSRNGVKTASISIQITNTFNERYINLDYKSNGEPIRYRIDIISKTSNLGKGEILYFVCPSTGKYCRKLILSGGYFLHRCAFNGLLYPKSN